MRAVIYCRVSTAEQATEGLSLDAQEARGRAWADAHGVESLEVIADAGVSGTKALSDRPGGAQIAALLDSRRPSADVVVVARLDRLGRDAAETLTLLKRFRTGKVGLVSLAEHVDLATPHGRAMAGVGAVFAELERALIAQRTAEALRELRRQGRPWNHAPFGWDVVEGRLVANKSEQEILERARELREAGWGYDRIAKAFAAEGRPTKRGGKWAAMTVRSVLRSSESVAAA